MAAKKGNTEAAGHALALELLDEMREIGMDELGLDGAQKYRDGRPQNDVLTRYLRVAQRHPAVEKGFLAVLTDVIGSKAEIIGSADYRRIVKRAEREVRAEAARG